jgi:hypothetical protein
VPEPKKKGRGLQGWRAMVDRRKRSMGRADDDVHGSAPAAGGVDGGPAGGSCEGG